ncbi:MULTISPECIES: proteasome subunit alpha [Amycolatopsis]|uniref:Proteasome subunit alpha n=1 Tax=Amycolatopsis dendrobii TaxID=2760662 RepID=A0A7W3W344_9PSEU|nr:MULTISPECIES: proteasome subunit alpha [Amycolatopsis]MBB1157910.1 proteasome subunit alpha [Amycolatopsis dendrobii]UKD57287.1 proteasome subunit alpha [Amycolatopsis sp. FU40]
MTMPLYASPEQLMRERSELARKGIARGRSVVVLKYSGGVLFVAENTSATLHKVAEIYDRIGFAAVGRFSEFENLRVAGIRHADLKGYQYDRRDVSARALANAYAATLGSIFTEQLKPFEVEVCLAEVGATAAEDQLYRLTFDGGIFDESPFVVMGGQTDTISAKLKDVVDPEHDLRTALASAIEGLRATATPNGNGAAAETEIKLEVAVLDRARPRRAFRRLSGAALEALLPAKEEPAEKPDESGEGDGKDSGSGKGEGSAEKE